jgi:hypothetical protein
MVDIAKPAEELTVSDLQEFPVWEFVDDDSLGETSVRPVAELPTNSLFGRLLGLPVTLSNGRVMFGLVGNVDLNDEASTRHFLQLSLNHNGKWSHLARYHDPDVETHGPEHLARSIGLGVSDVFPIVLDMRPWCIAGESALVRTIERQPTERLSSHELMQLALRRSAE